MADTLETELKTYEASVQQLLPDQGKYVLIKGTEIVGIFDSYNDSLKAGYEKFGIQPFLVKKIAPPEQAHFVSRDILLTCPT